jgi:hypothetical protein
VKLAAGQVGLAVGLTVKHSTGNAVMLPQELIDQQLPGKGTALILSLPKSVDMFFPGGG